MCWYSGFPSPLRNKKTHRKQTVETRPTATLRLRRVGAILFGDGGLPSLPTVQATTCFVRMLINPSPKDKRIRRSDRTPSPLWPAMARTNTTDERHAGRHLCSVSASGGQRVHETGVSMKDQVPNAIQNTAAVDCLVYPKTAPRHRRQLRTARTSYPRNGGRQRP